MLDKYVKMLYEKEDEKMEIKNVKANKPKYPFKKCAAVAAAVALTAALGGCSAGDTLDDAFYEMKVKLGCVTSEPAYDGGLQYEGDMTYGAPDDDIDTVMTLSGTDQSATDISCTDCE